MDALRESLSRALISDTASIRSRVSTLPEYSPFPSPALPSRSEHTLSRTRSGYVVRLNLTSHAHSSESTPTFFDLTQVSGTVDLDITNRSNISSVVVALRCFGSMLLDHGMRPNNAMADDQLDHGTTIFAESSAILWRHASGRRSSIVPLGQGHHSWDFTLSLPSTITDKKNGDIYPLPPSFIFRESPHSIQFMIEVVLEQKGLFSDDYSFKTKLRYLPQTAPSPPSLIRLSAYREGTGLPGPEVDPAGYCTRRSGTLYTRLFGSQKVQLECILALANPTQYPRGYALPLFITMTSNHLPALDLLATPKALIVSLRRTLSFKLESSDRWEKFQEGLVGEARCWFAGLDGARGYRRILQGEILVRKDLFPSFSSPSIALQYTILVSLDSPGFSFISRSSREPILSVPVVITSNCAPGPKPCSYAPVPVYSERSR